jgi:protein-serine/threonine kinase
MGNERAYRLIRRESTANSVSETIGDPSPLSSPLGQLSESPISESFIGGFPLHRDEPMKLSVDTLSSGYDLSR